MCARAQMRMSTDARTRQRYQISYQNKMKMKKKRTHTKETIQKQNQKLPRAKYETSYQLILNSLKPGAHAEHIKTSSSLKFRDFIL